jgi:hypothetical protein
MKESMTFQGRQVTSRDVDLIRQLIAEHPGWHRTRLSKELCQSWHWYSPKGTLKDMSCRNLLLKLDRQGHISLPPQRRVPPHIIPRQPPDMRHNTGPIVSKLSDLFPIQILDARENSQHHGLFNYFLHHYHYLGFRSTVGENMKYNAYDCYGRPLACLLFGAPAWKTKCRDQFIGWTPMAQKKNLNLLTNNTRFLILPWVKVKNLASHLLSWAASQLNDDWRQRYNHEIFMLETFVDTSRFYGTCYRAANWIFLGQTKGRTRNDRFNSIKVPLKSVYVQPLNKRFRKPLCQVLDFQ